MVRYLCYANIFIYFIKVNFRFPLKVCDGSHESMQKVVSFNNIAVAFRKRSDYKQFIFSIWVRINKHWREITS